MGYGRESINGVLLLLALLLLHRLDNHGGNSPSVLHVYFDCNPGHISGCFVHKIDRVSENSRIRPNSIFIPWLGDWNHYILPIDI